MTADASLPSTCVDGASRANALLTAVAGGGGRAKAARRAARALTGKGALASSCADRVSPAQVQPTAVTGGDGLATVARRAARSARALACVLGAVAMGGGAARAERVPVGVLWLPDAERASGAGASVERWAEIDPALAESVRRGLASSREVAPLADEEAERALQAGGPASAVSSRVARARTLFAAQRFADADALLAEAESTALGELPTAELGPLLGAIESMRLVCADLARDDAAAAHAARLHALSNAPATPELAAALARHPVAPSPGAGAVRVESDPDGADVYVDLRPVGKTPLDLPRDRRADALVDIELAGHRKVHRVAPPPGTLAVALGRDDRLGPAVDRLRRLYRERGELPPAEVAALGRRIGAGRVLVARIGRTHGADAAPAVEARLLDVARAAWSKPAVTVRLVGEGGGPALAARLASYAGPQPAASPTLADDHTPDPELDAARSADAVTGGARPSAAAGAVHATTPAGAAPTVARGAGAPASSGPAWKKWYTWVVGGVLVAGVLGFVIADHVGSDTITIHAQH